MRRGFPATHSVLLNCKLCFLCMVCGLAWAHTHLLKAFKTGFCFRFTFIYKHLHFMNHSENNMHYSQQIEILVSVFINALSKVWVLASNLQQTVWQFGTKLFCMWEFAAAFTSSLPHGLVGTLYLKRLCILPTACVSIAWAHNNDTFARNWSF